ncbi:MAG: hypothetical protein WA659_02195 [Candidatus Aquirickettsiella sp.]
MPTKTTARSNQFKLNENIKNENKENENKKISLLSSLKKVPTSFRMSELSKLIKREELEIPKWGISLKAIIILFPEGNRYVALERIKDNFDIQLTASQIEGLRDCLLRDPAFYKLLPFKQKQFLENLLVQQNDEKPVSRLMQKETKDVINAALRDTKSGQINKQSQTKAFRNKLLFDKKKANNEIQCSVSNTPENKITACKQKKTSQLRLSIISACPSSDLRLNYFKSSEKTRNTYQKISKQMSIEEFKNFIEIFPPRDVIKFLNIPLIENQIQGFRQQRCELNEKSYIDLLRYLAPYQKLDLKKLLIPIINSETNKKLEKLGIFKENKKNCINLLPDVIPSNKTFRTR